MAVADFLFARGFQIFARNLRLGALELDVVARRGKLVVIVEVRTRGERSLERAFESVGRVKRQRLVRAAGRLWRSRLAWNSEIDRVRIDVAAVSFSRGQTKVEYAEGVIAGS
ncbi:MAG: YraN family protein [Polyangiaceae bacterium]|jgi:putative endonuclease